jgi:hypothetical protein
VTRVFAVSFLLLSALGCSSTRRDLAAAPLPDLSRVDPGVQAQVRGRYETLTRALADRAEPPELAAAFGQYGMVLQAAEFYDVAEPTYLNAQKLAPDEIRWPYHLACSSSGRTICRRSSGLAGCTSIKVDPKPPNRCLPKRSPLRRERWRYWPA